MRSRHVASVLLIFAVGAVLANAPQVHAAPRGHAARADLARAYEMTVDALTRPGGSVIVDETSNRAREIFLSPVPAGSPVEYAYMASGADYSMRVYQLPGRSVIGQWGSNAQAGRWSSMGAAGSWAKGFIAGSPLSATTVVSGMDDRLDMDTADEATRAIVLNELLPPNTAQPSTWTKLRTSRGARGATVFTGSVKGRTCTYASISITVKDGVIRASDWTSTCDLTGTTVHHGTVDFVPGVSPVPSGAMTQDEAMASSANPTRDKAWKALVTAANATAARTWSDIVFVPDGQAGTALHHVNVIDALRPIDVLVRHGRSGIIRQFAGDGVTRYLITPSGTTGPLVTEDGVDYSGGTLTVGADGLIESISMYTTRTGANTTMFVK